MSLSVAQKMPRVRCGQSITDLRLEYKATANKAQMLLDRIQDLIDQRATGILSDDTFKLEENANEPPRWPSFVDDTAELLALKAMKQEVETGYAALEDLRWNLRMIAHARTNNRFRLAEMRDRLEAIRVPRGKSRKDLVALMKSHQGEHLALLTISTRLESLEDRANDLQKQCNEDMLSKCLHPADKMFARLTRQASGLKGDINNAPSTGVHAAKSHDSYLCDDRAGELITPKCAPGQREGDPWRSY